MLLFIAQHTIFLIHFFSPRIFAQQNLYYYDKNPNILEVDVKELKLLLFVKSLDNKPTHLVNFYAGPKTCRGDRCKDFKRAFEKLAEDVLIWYRLVKIVAINCDNGENMAFCYSIGIGEHAYPALRFYHRDANLPMDNIVLNIKDPLLVEKDSDYIRNELAVQLSQEYKRKLFSDWPNFNYIHDSIASLNELLQTLHELYANTVLAVIFEPEESLNGSTSILDFSSLPPNKLLIARAKHQSKLIQTYGIKLNSYAHDGTLAILSVEFNNCINCQKEGTMDDIRGQLKRFLKDDLILYNRHLPPFLIPVKKII